MSPTTPKFERGSNETTATAIGMLAELVSNGSATVNRSTESPCPPQEKDHSSRLHEFQIIKAVVLAVVTVFIMVSICKMIFQLFVRYTGKQDDG